MLTSFLEANVNNVVIFIQMLVFRLLTESHGPFIQLTSWELFILKLSGLVEWP